MFAPNYAIHPGVTLQELLGHLTMSQKDLADRIGVTEKHISEIVQGKSSITPDMAIKLEYATGAAASFLLGLQKKYDEITARMDNEKRVSAFAATASRYPYQTMVKFDWVAAASNVHEKAENLLKFFGVDTLDAVHRIHESAFRISKIREASPEALAAWLRKGELESQNVATQSFDRQRLIESLPRIKAMTEKRLVEYRDELTELCASLGVVLVVLPYLQKTYVNGATRWLGKDKVIVQLSLRYSYSDIFWFSFFHEIAHVLNHGKRGRFIDIEKSGSDKIDEELEADRFAAELLIPKEQLRAFIGSGDFSASAIKNLADNLGVGTGIVIGRLQHEKMIPYNSSLNHLRQRFAWRV